MTFDYFLLSSSLWKLTIKCHCPWALLAGVGGWSLNPKKSFKILPRILPKLGHIELSGKFFQLFWALIEIQTGRNWVIKLENVKKYFRQLIWQKKSFQQPSKEIDLNRICELTKNNWDEEDTCEDRHSKEHDEEVIAYQVVVGLIILIPNQYSRQHKPNSNTELKKCLYIFSRFPSPFFCPSNSADFIWW